MPDLRTENDERCAGAGTVEPAAAAAAAIGFLHFHKLVVGVQLDELAGLGGNAEALLEVAGVVERHLGDSTGIAEAKGLALATGKAVRSRRGSGSRRESPL